MRWIVARVKAFLLKHRIVKPEYVEIYSKNLRSDLAHLAKMPKDKRPTWRRIFVVHVTANRYNKAVKGKPLLVPPWVLIHQTGDKQDGQ